MGFVKSSKTSALILETYAANGVHAFPIASLALCNSVEIEAACSFMCAFQSVSKRLGI